MSLLSALICEVSELQLYLKTKVMFNFCLPVVPILMFPSNLFPSSHPPNSLNPLSLLPPISSTFSSYSTIVLLLLVAYIDTDNAGKEYKV